MILMLDFDGVMHPECADSSQLFCRTPLLWQIMRACPAVRVVFSTSWREIHRPDELLDFATFGGGEDLAHRFIGQTPIIVKEPGAFIPGRMYKREDECLEWLRINGGTNQPWLALDDIEYWFKGPNLHLVDHLTGLTDADVSAIIGKVSLYAEPEKIPAGIVGTPLGLEMIARMDSMAVDEEYCKLIAQKISGIRKS